ncbi:MAG: four helix bundle protein [Flavobacteriales bacterium]|jgi:four helix bundle protein|nr:four helix bundle protein [Flavobacteriales bacterium]|tara:strand:+ start:220804 stop:221175 length:372 start_codon:yes stop_codon:yes gene_type:complete
MSEIKSYKDLLVWEKGILIVKQTYKLTNLLPDNEKFGLTSQLRRAAVSIPSNIAEGYGRDYTRNYSQFLKIARGSLMELETQLIICRELEYLTEENTKEIDLLIIEEIKMLNSLIKKMNEYIS